MNLVRIEPWKLMGRLHTELDQLFGESYTTPTPTATADRHVAPTWTPSVDVHEETERFTVHADLPGIEAKDIRITADKGVLTIRGARRIEKRESQHGYQRLERIEGDFLRRFSLPENARTEEIKARHVNGVLEVVIPKLPVVEPRSINVEVN